MKLYRGKIPVIASEIVTTLVDEGHVEINPEFKGEAEQDLMSIMHSYLRQEDRLKNEVKDYLAKEQLSFDHKGEVRREKAKEANHPIGDKVMPFLASQFNQIIMNSPHFEEVYSEDKDIKTVIFNALRKHQVNEDELRQEAREKLNNLDENSLDFEILFPKALAEVRRKRGLM